MKSFASHCIHCKLQDILRSHDLKEKEIFQLPTMCKMERKVKINQDLFHTKTLTNALFKPSFPLPPMYKAP